MSRNSIFEPLKSIAISFYDVVVYILPPTVLNLCLFYIFFNRLYAPIHRFFFEYDISILFQFVLLFLFIFILFIEGNILTTFSSYLVNRFNAFIKLYFVHIYKRLRKRDSKFSISDAKNYISEIDRNYTKYKLENNNEKFSIEKRISKVMMSRNLLLVNSILIIITLLCNKFSWAFIIIHFILIFDFNVRFRWFVEIVSPNIE